MSKSDSFSPISYRVTAILPQSVPPLHFHSPTAGVHPTPAQVCEGQIPFLPACCFPATFDRVHIRRALVHQPVPDKQRRLPWSGRAGLGFGLLPFQCDLFRVVRSPSVNYWHLWNTREANERCRCFWVGSTCGVHSPVTVRAVPSYRRLFPEHSASSDSGAQSAAFLLLWYDKQHLHYTPPMTPNRCIDSNHYLTQFFFIGFQLLH